MGNGKVNWYEIRVKVPENIHSDLKTISDETDVTMSNLLKPKIRETIEGYAHFLPVGSNRANKKEG